MFLWTSSHHEIHYQQTEIESAYLQCSWACNLASRWKRLNFERSMEKKTQNQALIKTAVGYGSAIWLSIIASSLCNCFACGWHGASVTFERTVASWRDWRESGNDNTPFANLHQWKKSNQSPANKNHITAPATPASIDTFVTRQVARHQLCTPDSSVKRSYTTVWQHMMWHDRCFSKIISKSDAEACVRNVPYVAVWYDNRNNKVKGNLVKTGVRQNVKQLSIKNQ